MSNQNSLNPELAVRVDDTNLNHHLWNNNGTWWCHFTLHLPDYTSQRVRISLKTKDIQTARHKRDILLDSYLTRATAA